jgi:hypothetical protein
MENETQEPSLSSADLPDGAAPLVDLARERLASKYGFDPGQTSLLSVTPMDWPDASLGCPRDGASYAEVVTPGFVILLQHGVTVYSFHTDTADEAILCQVSPPDNIFIEP